MNNKSYEPYLVDHVRYQALNFVSVHQLPATPHTDSRTEFCDRYPRAANWCGLALFGLVESSSDKDLA